MTEADSILIRTIEKEATPLTGQTGDFDAIIEAARGKSVVMLGEASHGTHEFYQARAQITRRLVEELGFASVAVEADWPDAYALNRYVWNLDPGKQAEEVFHAFERFPTWMWANTEVLAFIRWLAEFNAAPPRAEAGLRPVGFYGLDLYSMSSSAHAVIAYLDKHDPPAAVRARERYACLDQYLDEPHLYGQSVEFGLSASCESAITEQLQEMQTRAFRRLEGLGLVSDEQRFCAEQNARLVRNAEEYYRAMFRGRPNSWNIRDGHMFETLEALRSHLSHQLGEPAGVVVWAHNSHVGNAAATEMGARGELNMGQLARERYGDDALLVGFSTATGDVTAASDWDVPGERKQIRQPLAGSYEALFHTVAHERFLLDLRGPGSLATQLAEARLQRAIGVIYRPETERHSHYYYSRLAEQFDFMLHYDHTRALQPLAMPEVQSADIAETWPSGL
ncbi:Erythromycin esterase homolog [Halopseudomonas litoralis]|uniref:Erythromycin esterase homolog n=1 Tax=Halopseudomonas litoralis TaxID=797277 RepID=A0A1H1LBF2_9GAMM|nr:erythromycin esterase family protein [Halopseudomonas litoralis]SDR71813.1 Erythromycin esterase homolog [Halopseudomonas litoralis]